MLTCRSTSVANFWAYIEGKKTDDDLKESGGNWVDVRHSRFELGVNEC